MTINSKHAKNTCDQKRIKRWFPSGRAGGLVKRITETPALSKRAPDAAHLEAKVEIFFVSLDQDAAMGAEPVSVSDDDVSEAHSEGDDYHPQKRCSRVCPPAPTSAHSGSSRNRGIHHAEDRCTTIQSAG